MNVTELALPEKIERWQGQRCEAIVTSTGTHYFDGNKHQCARMARFDIDGSRLCPQHAGEICLRYTVKQQENDDVHT